MARRKSIRQFLPRPVGDDILRDLLERAARSPSGGNVQPWRIYVVNGDSMDRFREFIADRPVEAGEYDIYPPNLWEPYRTNRSRSASRCTRRSASAARTRPADCGNSPRTPSFFGAPAGLFCFIDRAIGPPQWSDLGMFLQTFMLLAQEAGIDTCAQEYSSVRHHAVTEFVGAPRRR